MSLWRFGLLAAAAHAQCVTKQLISAGDGVTFPQPGDTVSMHYTGTLASTGAKFDSSRDRGKEFSTAIGVGQVIQGWDQGVPQMSLGEHAILRISAACGYGQQGSPPVIPPNADLVFDVELLGLNGRRAGASTAPAFAAPPAFPNPMPLAPAPTPAKAIGPPSSLPKCTPSDCGHAISFDTTGVSGKPLCLCSPLCVQWANTPGVLPCCPGLQEVCLDPYRSPSPRPLTAGVSSTDNAAPQMSSPQPMMSFPQPMMSSMMSAPQAMSAPQPMMSAPQAPAATALAQRMASAPQASALPTCRPNSCGMGMASGVNSMTAICACDAACLTPGYPLPCCQSFREVCQPGSVSAPATLPAPISQAQFNAQASATFSAPISQAQFAAQTSSSMQQNAAQQQNAPVQQQAAPVQPQTAPVQKSAPAQQPSSTQGAATSSQSAPAGCALGKTAWAEQPTCDKKRWAIQNGKCKKVCPSVDTQSGIKYYPTGGPGKDACAAALALCK